MFKVPGKFPVVTVTLVLAALLYVLWDQTREQTQPIDAMRFTNLDANPVKLSTTVDWLVTQIPLLCEQVTGKAEGTEANGLCVKQAKARTSACRRGIYDRFPSVLDTDSSFRDVSITLMNCLVQASST